MNVRRLLPLGRRTWHLVCPGASRWERAAILILAGGLLANAAAMALYHRFEVSNVVRHRDTFASKDWFEAASLRWTHQGPFAFEFFLFVRAETAEDAVVVLPDPDRLVGPSRLLTVAESAVAILAPRRVVTSKVARTGDSPFPITHLILPAGETAPYPGRIVPFPCDAGHELEGYALLELHP